ncbi:MAG: hypothetical protein ACTSRW_14015 [Candidatus Helarchaeota archaeon]
MSNEFKNDREIDEFLIDAICRRACAFHKEGEEYENDAYQCGGFKSVKWLIKQGKILRQDLLKFGKEIVENNLKQEKDSKE